MFQLRHIFLYIVVVVLCFDSILAQDDVDELRKYQKTYRLKNTPRKINTKAFKGENGIGLHVVVNAQTVDLSLERNPIAPLDGHTRQYTYRCFSEQYRNEMLCSVALRPNGDVRSMIVYWGEDTWIFEGIGDGKSMLFRASDLEESDFQDIALYPQNRKVRAMQARRQTNEDKTLPRNNPSTIYNDDENELNEVSNFGYASHNKHSRARRAIYKVTQIRMTYDKVYLTRLAQLQGLSSSQATISQADTVTMVQLNHMNTVYENQVGITFQLYPNSRVPGSAFANGNYGTTSDGSAILDSFGDDIIGNVDDLNVLMTGRNLINNVIGLAWVSGACDKSYNSAVLAPLTLHGLFISQVSLFAHEVGHSFNCQHNTDPTSLMYYSENGSLTFGSTSRNVIAAHVREVEANIHGWYHDQCFDVQSVDDNSPCESNTCGAGGTCVEVGSSYTCQCNEGFRLSNDGFKCEDALDQCVGNPCGEGGDCSDGLNSYTCTCKIGYTLSNDKKSCIHVCANKPCGGGICSISGNDYSCICAGTGMEGRNCETDVNECVKDAPCAHGDCVNSVGSFGCVCDAGYSGTLCDVNTKCDATPCMNGGECSPSNSAAGYTCSCDGTGMTGQHCETDIDECASTPCVHGECRNGIDSFVCACHTGYGGILCEQNQECETGFCWNGVTCQTSDSAVGKPCTCVEGYAGPQCGTRIGTCADGDACLNDGLCTTNADNTYNCKCPPGYKGARCAQNINECITANTCVVANTVTCRDKHLGVVCECKPGYSGDNCQIDSCTCLNGGTCELDHYGVDMCRCPLGYHGTNCENRPLLNRNQENACAMNENSCNGRGNCRNKDIGDGLTEPECMCFGGFDSVDCATALFDSCESSPCQFAGACRNSRFGTFRCTCVPGRYGPLCEQDVDECDPDPCMVGKCQNGHNRFKCICPTGWYGEFCSLRTR